jgi:multidrug efflux pump subunit AcrA (membrane-fusion protein)
VRSRSTRRRQLVAVVALLAVAGVAATGWLAGTRVQSPETAAARAAPPEPSPITAPVELRVLSSRVVVRGDVVPGRSATVMGPSSEDGTVVTGVLVEIGDQLTEGSVVVEVSGRPVVVFEGTVPAFRDIRPGMSGPDVEQLHAALTRVGCDPAADEGTYGEATKGCVARMYEALGYATVPTSETEADDLAEARGAAAEAEEQLATAGAALRDAQQATTPAELTEQQIAVDAARRKVDQDAATGRDNRAEASAAVDAAVMKLNAELADVASPPADRTTALAELEAAVVAAGAADRDARETVAAAEEALRLAESQLAELTAPPDVESETVAVEQATAAVERTAQALAELEGRSGPIVPLGELVFVDALPATVSALNAEIGQSVGSSDNDFDGSTDPLAVLATAGLQVEAFVPASEADLVEVGMDVELTDDTVSQDSLVARLASIGDQVESSDDGSERGLPAVIEPVDALPRQWTGRNVRVTFTAAATPSEVLVVPEAALSSGADGEARVQVLNDDGTLTTVNVEPGLSAEGFVEVAPIDDGGLAEGDQVIVGGNG